MDFTAKWITGPAKIDRDSEVAPYLFRKQVTLPANVKSAVLYATALGVYSIFADNHKISDTYFAPGYTEYSQRLQYQEYDVTSLLSGKSSFVLTAELADGWYAGRDSAIWKTAMAKNVRFWQNFMLPLQMAVSRSSQPILLSK